MGPHERDVVDLLDSVEGIFVEVEATLVSGEPRSPYGCGRNGVVIACWSGESP